MTDYNRYTVWAVLAIWLIPQPHPSCLLCAAPARGLLLPPPPSPCACRYGADPMDVASEAYGGGAAKPRILLMGLRRYEATPPHVWL